MGLCTVLEKLLSSRDVSRGTFLHINLSAWPESLLLNHVSLNNLYMAHKS
jgi:hypothetical protein